MKSKLLAESPEDLWGDLTTCPRCENDFYSGDLSGECPECGLEEEYDPDPDLYAEEYPVGYDGTGRW